MGKEKTNVDIIGKNGSAGPVAERLYQGSLNLGRMRPFIDHSTGEPYMTVYKGGNPNKPENWATVPCYAGATLRREEWMALDEVLVEVGRYRLGGYQDLLDRGLTYTLGNAMGTTVLEWHDVSDAFEAELTMDAVTRTLGDRPVFQHNYLPIPIIHVDYEINARVLEVSRRLGNPLDVTSAERAARRVYEKMENMLFGENETYSYGSKDSRDRNTIYSYLNFPDRHQITLDKAWDASGTTPAHILEDVQTMKQISIDSHKYGPWMIYIPTNYETRMDDDYDVSGSSLMTIRERIMKIGGILGIKVIDSLKKDNVLMVQMTPDTVRLVRGMDLQNIQWSTEGGMVTKFKVIAIQVPQIRSDMDRKSGIMHLA